MSEVIKVPLPASGADNQEDKFFEEEKKTSFLHKLGLFFLQSVLPVALEVVVPILERK